MDLDFDRCYAAAASRDARFDGVFFTGVTSTGIYCRPSCPAITPKPQNMRFYPTSAAAQLAGFRACKRCRPDASPGSPEWNIRQDLVGRAMQMIGDGVVDRDGVGGLAARLHVSERHLHRQLLAELGAGPQAIARAYRAQTARVLIETTKLTFSEIAFAAGFSSIRQFNDTIQTVFASTPTALRARRKPSDATGGEIMLRLPFRKPFDGSAVLRFVGERCVAGIESWDGTTYARTLSLPHSSGSVALSLDNGFVRCVLKLQDVRDLATAVQRCRQLFDLDADGAAIDDALAKDRRLRRHVRRSPGRRVPGTVSGQELAMRAVVGQQVSTKAARTIAARIVDQFGKPLTAPVGALTHLWPTSDALADADLSALGIPKSRGVTIRLLAQSLATGRIDLEPGADRTAARVMLLEIPGIGPWTADYIVMRALNDPDRFLPTDLGVVKGLRALGYDGDPSEVAAPWAPWRSYAVQHIWSVTR